MLTALYSGNELASIFIFQIEQVDSKDTGVDLQKCLEKKSSRNGSDDNRLPDKSGV